MQLDGRSSYGVAGVRHDAEGARLSGRTGAALAGTVRRSGGKPPDAADALNLLENRV